jgi:hypothetical protein
MSEMPCYLWDGQISLGGESRQMVPVPLEYSSILVAKTRQFWRLFSDSSDYQSLCRQQVEIFHVPWHGRGRRIPTTNSLNSPGRVPASSRYGNRSPMKSAIPA